MTQQILLKILLFGDPHNNATMATVIVNATIDFVQDTKRFDVPLLSHSRHYVYLAISDFIYY